VAVEVTLKVTVELPEPGAGSVGGLNAAVTPAGSPTADNETAEEKPPLMLEVAETDLLLPRWMLTLAGLAESEKSAELGVLMV
jgi:hypothetical protein